MRVVSGIQPTGNLHLGNYLGAIRNWAAMQDSLEPGSEALFFLADLHALSQPARHDSPQSRYGQPTMPDTTIFEALRESHERQRALSTALTDPSGDSPERRALFDELKTELAAHALAEDRHFYVPLMAHDAGIDLSRHAIAEHHQIDEMVESLEETEPSSPAWLPLARKLADKVEHHLQEEEHRFFQMAGKLLTEKQKTALAASYRDDYEDAKAAPA